MKRVERDFITLFNCLWYRDFPVSEAHAIAGRADWTIHLGLVVRQCATLLGATPDGRYFVVKGQLWRCSNPSLSDEERQYLVHDLMEARRAVKEAKASNDADQLRSARAAVDEAKVALGERGPVWWDDGSPDYNRHKAINTPYAGWYRSLLQAQ